jgi:hypothetical protein
MIPPTRLADFLAGKKFACGGIGGFVCEIILIVVKSCCDSVVLAATATAASFLGGLVQKTMFSVVERN